MGWVDIPLATGAGEDASPYISDAELVNLMMVPNPPGSMRPFSVINTPALVGGLVQDPARIEAQGMIQHGDYLWFLLDGRAKYYDGVTVTDIASGLNQSNPYRLVGTGSNQIVGVNGTGAYKITTSAVTAITPPAGTYIGVTALDGFTIYARKNTDEFYVSDLDDPTTIGALSFSTADAVPDSLLAVATSHRDLVLMGRRHLEFWYNTGGSFPFSRSSPGTVDVGVADAGAVAKIDDAIFMLGHDFRIYRIEGQSVVPVSTRWVERLIRKTFDNQKARASAFRDNGRTFFCLSYNEYNIGETAKNIVLDVDSGLWHVREHTAATLGRAAYIDVAEYRLSANWVRTFVATTLGNYTYGDVYRFDPDSYRDATASGSSTDTTRTLTCPAFEVPGGRSFCAEVELQMEKANGGSPGTVTLKYSDDGGSSYTTHSAQSTNQDRVRWQRLGMFQRRIFRFEFTTNARVAIHNVRARIEGAAA